MLVPLITRCAPNHRDELGTPCVVGKFPEAHGSYPADGVQEHLGPARKGECASSTLGARSSATSSVDSRRLLRLGTRNLSGAGRLNCRAHSSLLCPGLRFRSNVSARTSRGGPHPCARAGLPCEGDPQSVCPREDLHQVRGVNCANVPGVRALSTFAPMGVLTCPSAKGVCGP